MKKMPIAYQLYSAKQEMKQDLVGTLRQVKELGFAGVEFAGFFGRSAAEIKQILDEIGLVPVSSHVALSLLEGDLEEVLRFHQELGCSYIVVPWLGEVDRPGGTGFAKSLRSLHNIGLACHNAGIELLYHNHDFEFRRVSGIYGLDFIFEAIPPHLLKTQIDTCWVKYAGVDPVSYLASYKGRAPLVHIKDFVAQNNSRTPYALIDTEGSAPAPDYSGFSYRPFGHGSQDAGALVQAAIDADAKWLVLEQDEPSQSPMADAKLSMETFRNLGVL